MIKNEIKSTIILKKRLNSKPAYNETYLKTKMRSY